jgi:predicted TIM-barrel fold metal-dependent hydrolase
VKQVPSVVDAGVFPQLAHPDDLRKFMPEPWKHRSFPPPQRYHYPAPQGEYVESSWPKAGLPGSDPIQLSRDVLDEGGADFAVLVPLTRGILPDLDLANAICHATNEWLADTWLNKAGADSRFKGSIRVNPGDPDQAVAEIEHWAGHPHMVQVAIPLESLQPYGKRMYFRVWQAANDHGLPVLIHSDGGAGLEWAPTSVGYCRHYAEFSALNPLNMFFHLSSFIAEGVFERLPEFKVVFGDGGSDVVMPLMWRMDMTWRSTRNEMPRAKSLPTSYLRDHVRFFTQRLEGPEEAATNIDWQIVNAASELQVFASNYPIWSAGSREQTERRLPEALRHQIMGENSRQLYRLD